MNLAALYELIKSFEGCRLMPYYCPAGVLTCGWGSTGRDVFPGQQWTQEYADYRMKADALKFAAETKKLCPDIDGERLCAIADFAYNLGTGALASSTLRKKINSREFESAKSEIKKWVWGGGKKLPGLILRRGAEASLL